MKRLISLIIVIICILVSTISLNAAAFDWKSLNADLIDQNEDGSKTVLTLKDKQNRIFKVIYEDEVVTGKLVDKIIQFKNEFYTWRNIHFKDISFKVFANFLEVVIVPQEVNHNNLNLASAIPSGIIMNYDPEKDIMHYDFRIMKENIFVPLTGDYLNEGELVTKIGFAYDNPSAYLQQITPQAPVTDNGNYSAENEKIRQALIYLYDEDWHGRQKAIPSETIQKVVELRMNNPKMTKNQFWKELKKRKVKITKREMDLILIFYFNEFE